jgi:chromosome segregation ATPase
VTLLNTKSSLEEQISVLRKQCADMEEGLHADTSDISALRSENSFLEGKVTELERDNEDCQRELAEARLELEKLRLEGERNRLQFEQSAGDYLREKDESLKRERGAVMAEVSHLQHEKEQLLVCVRREERRRRDALRELARANEERDLSQLSLKENSAELQQLKEAYRKHLGTILEGENPQTQPRTARSGASGSGGGESSDLSWQAMSESYIQTEKKLMAEVERGNENVRQTVTALRKLYDHYRCGALLRPNNPPHTLLLHAQVGSGSH